jgi:hypothetical protein
MSGELLKFLGSILAVGGLVAIAWRLRLGGSGAALADEGEARELADNAICGFAAAEVALDARGKGALLRDGDGRIVLLRPHGVHFAARLLDRASTVKRAGPILTIATGETTFAPAQIDLGDAAETWDNRIAASHI